MVFIAHDHQGFVHLVSSMGTHTLPIVILTVPLTTFKKLIFRSLWLAAKSMNMLWLFISYIRLKTYVLNMLERKKKSTLK